MKYEKQLYRWVLPLLPPDAVVESKSQSNSQVTPTQVPVQQALETGNALLVSDPNDFIRESRQVVEAHKKQSNAIKSAIAKIFRVFYWDPTHDAAILLLPMDSTTPC